MPHKAICGKVWSFEHMLQHAARKRPSETSVPWLPTAQLGFKRSPALLYQLSMLKHTPNMDYIVRTPFDTFLYASLTSLQLMNADQPDLKVVVATVYRSCRSGHTPVSFRTHRYDVTRQGRAVDVQKPR